MFDRYVFGVQIPPHKVFGSLGFGIVFLGCGFKFIFTPILGKKIPILMSIFFKSVVQPPTRFVFLVLDVLFLGDLFTDWDPMVMKSPWKNHHLRYCDGVKVRMPDPFPPKKYPESWNASGILGLGCYPVLHHWIIIICLEPFFPRHLKIAYP